MTEQFVYVTMYAVWHQPERFCLSHVFDSVDAAKASKPRIDWEEVQPGIEWRGKDDYGLGGNRFGIYRRVLERKSA